MKSLLLFISLALWSADAHASVTVLPTVVDLQWLNDALDQSDTLTVLEGLPTPYEGKARAAELKRMPTLAIGDQALYLLPLKISDDDRHRLAELFQSTQVLVPPPIGGLPFKFCGGFHADYAIRWEKKGNTLVYALICFGCWEIRLVEGDLVVTADMTKEGRVALAKILRPYRQERPPFRLDQSVETKPVTPTPPKLEYKP